MDRLKQLKKGLATLPIRRLAALCGHGGSHEANRMTVEVYRRAEEKIRKMVADGKVSKEDAETRLRRMRLAMQLGERAKGTKGVKPRFISEEEYNRVSAELRKQVAEGNTMAHIEKSVKEGKTTRAEADALLEKLGYK